MNPATLSAHPRTLSSSSRAGRRSGAPSPAFDPNVGLADRVARMSLGFAALLLAAVTLETLWAVVGAFVFATGFAGRCPLYPLFGWSTRRDG